MHLKAGDRPKESWEPRTLGLSKCLQCYGLCQAKTRRHEIKVSPISGRVITSWLLGSTMQEVRARRLGIKHRKPERGLGFLNYLTKQIPQMHILSKRSSKSFMGLVSWLSSEATLCNAGIPYGHQFAWQLQSWSSSLLICWESSRRQHMSLGYCIHMEVLDGVPGSYLQPDRSPHHC